MKFVSFFAVILTAGQCFAEPAVGFSKISVFSPVDRQLQLSVWYPSDAEATDTVAGNAVFRGVSAVVGSEFFREPLPLVVVSHGGLRSAPDSGAWLSSSIADAGYIAVEINAPRVERAPVALDEIWHRANDVTRTIDAMLEDRQVG